MLQKYVVGDRVVCVKGYGDGAIPGDMGTVVKVYADPHNAPIIFWDDYRRCRHTADGSVPDGHGWFIHNSHIELCKVNDLGEFATNLETCSIIELIGG